MKRTTLMLLFSLTSPLLRLYADGPSKCGTNLTTLTVGTDIAGNIGYPPFEQQVGANLVGFDIAVATEISHRLGFQSTTFRQIPFSSFDITNNPFPLLHELNKPVSQLDIAVAALSIVDRPDPLRRTTIGFTNIGSVIYNDDSMGVIISAKADAKFSDPATFLQLINDSNTPTQSANAVLIQNSREQMIVNANQFFLNVEDQYKNIEVIAKITLQEVVAEFNSTLNNQALTNRRFIFVDNATAFKLINDTSLFPEGSVRFISNVIDAKNVSPSKGLGIAVGGITQGSEACDQLLENIAQAVKDMVADGTLARLREEFNVTSSDDNLGTTSITTNTQVTINSNVLHNFYFSKYGTPIMIIGLPVPVIK